MNKITLFSTVLILSSFNCFSKEEYSIEIQNKENHGGAFYSYFQIKDSDGKPVSEDQIELSHTKKLHAFVIDDSLSDYQHVHPEYAEDDQTFILKFKPKKSTNYKLWTEFKKDGETHTQQVDLVSNWKEVYKQEINGYRFELHTDEKVKVDEMINFEILVTSSKNKKVKLQEILGAYAHITCFTQDGKSMLHVHNSDSHSSNHESHEAAKEDEHTEHSKSLAEAGIVDPKSSVKFSLKPAQQGFYRIFAQLKIDGKEITAPFTIKVLAE